MTLTFLALLCAATAPTSVARHTRCHVAATTPATDVAMATTGGPAGEEDVTSSRDGLQAAHRLSSTFLPESAELKPGDSIPVNAKVSSGDFCDLDRPANITAHARPVDPDIATLDGVPSWSFDPVLAELTIDILVVGGARMGWTCINITVEWLVGDVIVVDYVIYHVTVTRSVVRSNIHNLLTYVTLGLALVMLLLAACNTTLADMWSARLWVLVVVLLQAVLVPLLCLVAVQLLGIWPYQKLGVMAAAVSPVCPVLIAFAVLVRADMALAVAIFFTNYILANVSMPLWSLQFGRVDMWDVAPSDVPFLAIDSILVVGLILFALGLLLRHLLSDLAETLLKLAPYFAIATVLCALVSGIYGASDLAPSLRWREALLCFLWPLLVGGAVILMLVWRGSTGSRVRAAGLCLLLKSCLLSCLFLQTAFPKANYDVAMVSANFFALMSLMTTFTLALVHVCSGLCCNLQDKDEGGETDEPSGLDKAQLVLEVQDHDETKPIVAAKEAKRENPQQELQALRDRLNMAGAAMNASSFGAPIISL